MIDIIRTWEGLVKYRSTFPGGPIGFFADVAQWGFVYKNMLYLLQTLLGDGVVVSQSRSVTIDHLIFNIGQIYRCYVVWKSWWITIFPILLWSSVAGMYIPHTHALERCSRGDDLSQVTGVGCVFADSHSTIDRENIFAPSTAPWITAFLGATLFTNIISTCETFYCLLV